MAKSRYSRKLKVQAVARLEAGEDVRDVAKSVGCSSRILGQWRDVIVAARPDLFPRLAGGRVGELTEADAAEAGKIADRIKEKQETVREVILDRLLEILPQATSPRELMQGYGILTNTSLVQQGKPTSIEANAGYAIPEDAAPGDLEKIAESLRNKRLAAPTREGVTD